MSISPYSAAADSAKAMLLEVSILCWISGTDCMIMPKKWPGLARALMRAFKLTREQALTWDAYLSIVKDELWCKVRLIDLRLPSALHCLIEASRLWSTLWSLLRDKSPIPMQGLWKCHFLCYISLTYRMIMPKKMARLSKDPHAIIQTDTSIL